MPRLLVHTNFGDGLRLKKQYLRNHTSDHHDRHIDTKLYPLRVQWWKARWKSSSNVWDTWQNAKEGKLSALQDKTRPFSVCGTATKLVLSRVDRHLLPRNFVHRVQGDPGSHNNRKWLLFARRRGAGRGSTAKASAFPWVGELRTNATAWVHGGFSQIKYLRLGEEKIFPSVPFFWKSELKWPHSVVLKPSTTIRRNLTGPALKG